MATNSAELMKGLTKDLAEAKTRQKQTSTALGVAPSRRPQANRGVRTKKRIGIGQDLRNANRQISKTVDELVTTAGFTDQFQAAQFRSKLTKQFNDAKMELLRKGNAAKKRALKLGLSQEAQSQLLNSVMGGVGEVTAAFVSHIDEKKKEAGE